MNSINQKLILLSSKKNKEKKKATSRKNYRKLKEEKLCRHISKNITVLSSMNHSQKYKKYS